MKNGVVLLLIAGLTWINGAFAIENSTFKFEHGRVELRLEKDSEQPGTLYGVVVFSLENGWHIYGQNPGDLGLPTEVAWHLPEKISVQGTEWPVPKEFSAQGLKSYGYENRLVLRTALKSSDVDSLTGLPVAANLSWLLCNDSCIPGSAQLGMVVPTATSIPLALSPVQSERAPGSLLIALLLGLGGGLLLNVMPCVFPILSIKILSIVNSQHPRTAKIHALLFGAGVILSFWFLAGMLMLLRATGEHLGWGFQFQSPIFVSTMIIVLLMVALNLLGVFEFGGSIQTIAGKADRRDGNIGAFLSGVLATAIATPCTAPLMGTAVAVALARPLLDALLIFTSLGVGMASPFVILSYSPRLASFLPRPGEWMNSLKQLLAFPLLASVAWLLWVLQTQADAETTFHLELGLVVASLGAWTYGKWSTPSASRIKRQIGFAAFGLGIACSIGTVWSVKTEAKESAEATIETRKEDVAWERFTPERLKELRDAHRPVLVDLTAAWCLVCQVNHRVAFKSESILQKLKEKNVTLLRGDWTKRDDHITAFLDSFGRDGVPLDVVFGTNGEGEVLPSVLTEGIVLNAISKLS